MLGCDCCTLTAFRSTLISPRHACIASRHIRIWPLHKLSSFFPHILDFYSTTADFAGHAGLASDICCFFFSYRVAYTIRAQCIHAFMGGCPIAYLMVSAFFSFWCFCGFFFLEGGFVWWEFYTWALLSRKGKWAFHFGCIGKRNSRGEYCEYISPRLMGRDRLEDILVGLRIARRLTRGDDAQRAESLGEEGEGERDSFVDVLCELYI